MTDRRRAEDVERSEHEQLRLLVQASEALLGALELDPLLHRILDLARSHIAADAYAVWRYQESLGEWQATASAGLSEAYRVAAIQAMNHSLAMPERPLLVENLDEEPMLARHREVHRLQGTQALLVVPLRIQHAIAGTLAFYFHRPHRFTEREVDLATILANLAGAAISAAEAYGAEVRFRAQAEAALSVRNQFLAVASHDLKNPLAGMKLEAQLLRRQLRKSAQLNPEEVAEGLAQIEANITRVISLLDELLEAAQVPDGPFFPDFPNARETPGDADSRRS